MLSLLLFFYDCYHLTFNLFIGFISQLYSYITITTVQRLLDLIAFMLYRPLIAFMLYRPPVESWKLYNYIDSSLLLKTNKCNFLATSVSMPVHCPLPTAIIDFPQPVLCTTLQCPSHGVRLNRIAAPKARDSLKSYEPVPFNLFQNHLLTIFYIFNIYYLPPSVGYPYFMLSLATRLTPVDRSSIGATCRYLLHCTSQAVYSATDTTPIRHRYLFIIKGW